MDVGLGIAGVASVALAVGHEVVGLAAVLQTVTEERVSPTVFGPASLTAAMIRVTWHLVGVFVLAAGGVLLTLGASDNRDGKAVVLRWLALMWLTATGVAVWEVRRSPRNILRLPVPLVWPVIAVLCWKASF